jgi:signal transduction histidine kinase
VDLALAEAFTAGEPTSGALAVSSGSRTRHVEWSLETAELIDTDRVGRSALLALTRDMGGEPSAVPMRRVRVLTLVDASDGIERERLRHQAARYASVAELSGGLAHEVRNPIAAIRSAAEQLADSECADETDRRLLAAVVRESDRLSTLVGDFLSFSRVGGGRPGTHALPRLVQDALGTASAAAAARGVSFRADVPGIDVHLDADLFYRALSNLLLNAAQWSAPNSEVRVSARVVDDELRLSVHDQGPGVGLEVRGRIFQPFFTTRAGGSGLGLAIAHRSAALMGGSLELDPAGASERGASFILTLPIRAPEAP